MTLLYSFAASYSHIASGLVPLSWGVQDFGLGGVGFRHSHCGFRCFKVRTGSKNRGPVPRSGHVGCKSEVMDEE